MRCVVGELWSEHKTRGIRSMAGLLVPRATVMVGPPFMARVPRSGVALRMSEALWKRQDRLLSLSRLWPTETKVLAGSPPQLAPAVPEWLSATMLFLVLTVAPPAGTKMPPPGAWTLELRTIVTFVSRAVPKLGR